MTVVRDNLDEENWDIRETFAFYGRAAYMASVLEVGLAHVLLHSQFMKRVHDELVATKGKGFDRTAYEAEFDKFMDEQFAQTMGNLIKRLSTFDGFDDALNLRIVEAKKRRDFLTHGFWRDRSVEFATAGGRARMRDELMADTEMFGQVDRAVDAAAKSTRECLDSTKPSLMVLAACTTLLNRAVCSAESPTSLASPTEAARFSNPI
jgi:hypothetical protein